MLDSLVYILISLVSEDHVKNVKRIFHFNQGKYGRAQIHVSRLAGLQYSTVVQNIRVLF